MDYQQFIDEQAAAIRLAVGSGIAINALSGGGDSSVVTLLGHRAVGERLKGATSSGRLGSLYEATVENTLGTRAFAAGL